MKRNILILVSLLYLVAFASPTVTVTPSKPSGEYILGEKVEFQIKATAEKLPVTLSLELIVNGKSVETTEVTTTVDGAASCAFLPFAPGNVRLVARMKDSTGKILAAGKVGTMYDIAHIRAAQPEAPKDFDAFWTQAKRELAVVPMRTEITDVTQFFVGQKQFAEYKIYDIKVDCAGPRPVSGILTVPQNAPKASLSAVVFYYSAAVCGATPRIFAPNTITFAVNAHGIDNLRPHAYYQALQKTWLDNYPTIGKESPRSYYFYGMYLRVLRALEYIKSRPEWNGKVLAVIGASQGGAQALFAGAMDSQVNFVVADIPGHCDYFGSLLDRKPGWPYIVQYDENKKLTEESKRTAITGGYFDSVFFARRMQAQHVFISTHLLDDACSAAGVFAAYNALPETVQKQIHTNLTKSHWPPDPDGQNAMVRFLKESAGK